MKTPIELLQDLYKSSAHEKPLSVEMDMATADSIWIGSEDSYYASIVQKGSGLYPLDIDTANFIALIHNMMPVLFEAVEALRLVDRAGAGDGVTNSEALDAALLVLAKLDEKETKTDEDQS